ncbi:MAG: helix-hairpin-helix domain-containing protein [Pelagibaca sp.]
MDIRTDRRKVPLDRLLVALGIRHVGSDVARRLARAFSTLDDLMGDSESEIDAVSGIGRET